MTTILDHIRRSIAEGMPARLDARGEEQGVLFLDENEFIPLDDLNYNEQLGYFRMSQFPGARRECENAPVDGRVFNRGAKGRTWAENTHAVTGYIPPDWARELSRLGAGSSQSDAVRTAIDLALHPFGDDPPAIVVLSSSLPCGVQGGSGSCGEPATVACAYAWTHPVYAGHFVLLPVCPSCAREAARLYE